MDPEKIIRSICLPGFTHWTYEVFENGWRIENQWPVADPGSGKEPVTVFYGHGHERGPGPCVFLSHRKAEEVDFEACLEVIREQVKGLT